MIFITLSDGIITKNMAYSARLTRRNEGYEKNEIFYTTDLIKVPNLELVAKDGGITMVGAGQFTIEVLSSETGYDSVVDFSSKDLSVIVKIWDEDDLSPIYTVLTGRAYLGAMNRKQYTYRLKSEKGELANDLLNPAPDIRQNAYLDADKSFYFETVDQGGNWSNTYNDNRLFPMRLGILKHVPLFTLAYNAPVTVPSDSVGEYYADGSVYALYDNGLTIRYSQYTGDYRVLKNNAASKAIYELTMDIDGDDTATKSDTLSKEILSPSHVFRQASEPSETVADEFGLIYDLKDTMLWYETDNNNKSFKWSGTAWEAITVTVTTDIIADNAIVESKINDLSISSGKIQNGAINNIQLDSSTAIVLGTSFTTIATVPVAIRSSSVGHNLYITYYDYTFTQNSASTLDIELCLLDDYDMFSQQQLEILASFSSTAASYNATWEVFALNAIRSVADYVGPGHFFIRAKASVASGYTCDSASLISIFGEK